MVVGIRAENITVKYGDFKVWENISISIDKPGLVAILGPNGVGKSTFMYTLNKLVVPVEGNVFLGDRNVKELEFKEIAKFVAYVPQKSDETFAMSVLDTVLMGRYPVTGFTTTKEDVHVAARCLKALGITDLAMRNFNELSAGQHQKVMLARGLVQRPDVLLLDEPTSNLDIKHQLGISRLLKHLSRENGIMVIMISHDLNIAAKYSDNVIMMHKGGIFAVGTPSEVMTCENIREVYGVDCTIIDDEGTPHLIMHDEGVDDGPLPCDAVCKITAE